MAPDESPRWEAAWCAQRQRWYYQDRLNGVSSFSRPEGCALVLPTRPPPQTDCLPSSTSSTSSARSSRKRWCRCRRRSAALATETVEDLPKGWESAWDPRHLRRYYFNRETQERSWVRPTCQQEPAVDERGVTEESAVEEHVVEICVAVDSDSADQPRSRSPSSPQLSPPPTPMSDAALRAGAKTSAGSSPSNPELQLPPAATLDVSVEAGAKTPAEGRCMETSSAALDSELASAAGKARPDAMFDLQTVHLEFKGSAEARLAKKSAQHEEVNNAATTASASSDLGVACKPGDEIQANDSVQDNALESACATSEVGVASKPGDEIQASTSLQDNAVGSACATSEVGTVRNPADEIHVNASLQGNAAKSAHATSEVGIACRPGDEIQTNASLQDNAAKSAHATSEVGVAFKPADEIQANAALLKRIYGFLQGPQAVDDVASAVPGGEVSAGPSDPPPVGLSGPRSSCSFMAAQELKLVTTALEKHQQDTGGVHSALAAEVQRKPSGEILELGKGTATSPSRAHGHTSMSNDSGIHVPPNSQVDSEQKQTPLVGLPAASSAMAQRCSSPDGSEISWKTASDGLNKTDSLTLSLEQGSLTVSLDEEFLSKHGSSPLERASFSPPPREGSLNSALCRGASPPFSDGSWQTCLSRPCHSARKEQLVSTADLQRHMSRSELLWAKTGHRRSRSWDPPSTPLPSDRELLRAASPAVHAFSPQLLRAASPAVHAFSPQLPRAAVPAVHAFSPPHTEDRKSSSVVLTPARAQYCPEAGDIRPTKDSAGVDAAGADFKFPASPAKGGKSKPKDGPSSAVSPGKGVQERADLLAAALSPKSSPGKKGGKGTGPLMAPPPKKGAVAGKGASDSGKTSQPRKPDIVPKIPLKKIFWNPICLAGVEDEASKSTESNVWEKIHTQGANFDTGELEMLFAEAPASRERAHSEKIEPSLSSKCPGAAPLPPPRRRMSVATDVRRVLEEKRRRQIWCMVALMPGRDLLPDAIAKLDNTVLSPENVELLLSNLPTEEEIDMLKAGMDAPPLGQNQPWDAAEDFMLMLISIPEYALRIQVWSFLNGFEAIHSRLSEARVELSNAADVLQDSERIQRLLAMILYVGNYLNGGTPRGRADGFDIDTLLKISNLKSLQKEFGGSLLDYVVRQIEQESPGMLWEMYSSDQEFEKIHCVRKHRMNDLIDELTELIKQGDSNFKRFEKCAAADECLEQRQRELEERMDKMKAVRVDFDELSRRYVKLYSWFQMDTQKMKATDEFFGIWSTFLEEVKKSLAWDVNKKKKRDPNSPINMPPTPGPTAARRTSLSSVSPRGPIARSRPSTPRRRSGSVSASQPDVSWQPPEAAALAQEFQRQVTMPNPGSLVKFFSEEDKVMTPTVFSRTISD